MTETELKTDATKTLESVKTVIDGLEDGTIKLEAKAKSVWATHEIYFVGFAAFVMGLVVMALFRHH